MFEKVQLFSLYGAAGTIELVGGILLVLGLFTRPVAFIASGQMAVAIHEPRATRIFPDPESRRSREFLFCFVFLYLVTAGGGPYSVDEMRKK